MQFPAEEAKKSGFTPARKNGYDVRSHVLSTNCFPL